jgi:hypothetical protein
VGGIRKRVESLGDGTGFCLGICPALAKTGLERGTQIWGRCWDGAPGRDLILSGMRKKKRWEKLRGRQVLHPRKSDNSHVTETPLSTTTIVLKQISKQEQHKNVDRRPMQSTGLATRANVNASPGRRRHRIRVVLEQVDRLRDDIRVVEAA